ncbi:AraC family transcriptional regulator [Mucilaginibacter limnophilus]|uniref:AraC family transcriptional regulator n=1 Tax=Mucilaginibacter limnophilus TaxID=1932778 RepID=A0A3S2UJS5_9SPHI|nr:AraC family transcriptional regulator [Mucilaginibacter limnophilus]RVT98125.1 AraC family transcriptional regulator [Mucilaginibacter limnophilus]
MKASYEVIQHPDKQSFLAREFHASAFQAPYHFHEEYELTYIIKGHGKRYAGSHMENFSSGDLVLLGPNIPHCWKLDDEEEENAGAFVIQFTGNFLGADFFNRYELRYINKLLQKSKSGISFNEDKRQEMAESLIRLKDEKNDFIKLIALLDILHQLAADERYKLLDPNSNIATISVSEQQRINPVFAYLVDNFRKQISLDEAAGIANMTPNAFCKFFKKTTRKTFFETIIEYRINYATQQLVQTDKPVSEIALESGFGDVSHFYKTFKSKMKLSPLNYRKKFMH